PVPSARALPRRAGPSPHDPPPPTRPLPTAETRTRRPVPPISSAGVPEWGNRGEPRACRPPRAAGGAVRAAPPHDEKGRLPRGGTGPAQESSAITGTAGGSLGALEDLHQTPPLGRGGRAGLHDEDTVADAGGVLLVVGLEAARLGRDLAVAGVLDTVLDLDHDGLVHLVGDHQTADGLAVRALGGRRVHALLVENLDLLGGRG